jgi:hypothetical protein
MRSCDFKEISEKKSEQCPINIASQAGEDHPALF